MTPIPIGVFAVLLDALVFRTIISSAERQHANISWFLHVLPSAAESVGKNWNDKNKFLTYLTGLS